MTDFDIDALLGTSRRNRIPRLPKGCDSQGRHPEAAEAATDIGADEPPKEPLTPAEAVLLVLIYAGSFGFVAYLAALARGWIN
jgi:hypothetical protein